MYVRSDYGSVKGSGAEVSFTQQFLFLLMLLHSLHSSLTRFKVSCMLVVTEGNLTERVKYI